MKGADFISCGHADQPSALNGAHSAQRDANRLSHAPRKDKTNSWRVTLMVMMKCKLLLFCAYYICKMICNDARSIHGDDPAVKTWASMPLLQGHARGYKKCCSVAAHASGSSFCTSTLRLTIDGHACSIQTQ